jgi:hypothetical protein
MDKIPLTPQYSEAFKQVYENLDNRIDAGNQGTEITKEALYKLGFGAINEPGGVSPYLTFPEPLRFSYRIKFEDAKNIIPNGWTIYLHTTTWGHLALKYPKNIQEVHDFYYGICDKRIGGVKETAPREIVFNERLDSIFLSCGFFRNGPSIGKGTTFDLNLDERYERRIRAYYDGPNAYRYEKQKITIFCMDRPIQKVYDNEADITEEQVMAFITLCK